MSPITPSDWATITPWGGAATTLASAAAISPTSFLTILTGNVAIVTINPPVPHPHMLALVFAGTAGVTLAASNGQNIGGTKASVAGETMLLIYNPASGSSPTGRYMPVG